MTDGDPIATAAERGHPVCLDVAYDFYGERLASGWSNGHVKIYERREDGTLEARCEWEAHAAPVLSVGWGHPEFSSGLVATCGQDRKASIWREDHPSESWTEVAKLLDASDEVRAVKFAPRHLGLRVATVSGDGFVRVYEAVDPVDLSNWLLMSEFAGGGTDEGGARRRLTSVDWNASPLDPPELLVSPDQDDARVWRYNVGAREWRPSARLDGAPCKQVTDVAWAPNPGRAFHLLALAGRDGSIGVWKLGGPPGVNDQACPNDMIAGALGGETSAGGIGVTLLATMRGAAPAWRVAWNMTGTVLSSSAEDGLVSLYEYAQDDLSKWIRIGTVPGGSQPLV